MLEILQNFEQAAAQFSPIVLILPGLTAVIVGLFVWLGGLGYRKLLVALLGAATGGICGFFLIRKNIIAAAVPAGLAALVAIIFERLLVTVLLTALAVVLIFAVLAQPHLKTAGAATPPDPYTTSPQGPAMGIHQSIETVKAYAIDFTGTIRQICTQMPAHSWAIIAALAAISIAAGFWLWRLASALCCAALGTLLIFAGLILLLLYKGSAPITKIADRSSFYAGVFVTMTAFGTLEQLLLFRRAEKESKRKKRATADKQESEQTTRSWRTE